MPHGDSTGGAGAGRRWEGADAEVVAGRLIPNSEPLMEAGLGVDLPSRQPQLRSGWGEYELRRAPGWFVAGNVVGAICPAPSQAMRL